MKRAHIVLTLILMTLLIPAVTVSAQDTPGILGQKAPSWTVDNWFNLDIPVGHAGAAVKGGSLGIMDAYRTPGTPWTVIIDREGIVQFDFWGIDVADAVNLVDLLRKNSSVNR